MKYCSIYLLFSLLLIIGCKKDTIPYKAGEIRVRIQWEATAEQFFQLCNDHSLGIKEMSQFEYTSPYDADSIDVIREYILARTYTQDPVRGSKTLPSLDSNGKVKINILLQDMDAADQEDFLNMLQRWQFTDLNVGTKAAILTVPKGDEQYWCDQLSNNTLVRWTSLNHINPPMD